MKQEVLIIGSGIGGLTAGALLAKKGFSVKILEANYLPGGCCSSYWRKGYIFESGATTLMGLDEGQPLRILLDELSTQLDYEVLNPAMTVWINGKPILKPQKLNEWIEIACQTFGNAPQQKQFWEFTWKLSEFVWRVSRINQQFPPVHLNDWITLAMNNRISDFPKLRFAFQSVRTVLKSFGLEKNTLFQRFLDEQLLITSQATIAETPYLFAAPALCYTNYTNVYLKGGMIQLPEKLILSIQSNGGEVLLRKQVTHIEKRNKIWVARLKNGEEYSAPIVIANIPIWNLVEMVREPNLSQYLQEKTKLFPNYWGAFTMGVVVDDNFPPNLTLHHQIHTEKKLPICHSSSIFVSISSKSDIIRVPSGQRVLAISTHTKNPQQWFENRESYEERKELVKQEILRSLTILSGFDSQRIRYEISSTPLSWEKWTFRKYGTVGGIPQDVKKPFYRWTGALTPSNGFYLCGDTTFPGQGVPGVALGGMIAANRILNQT
ncbi:MAG: NAD(P)/FAD-dependent oxidoreductase [Bacteroidia bacterium]|nr:NAD(P)/FAD-dependent oxidoreductase [Bacteroidia bacterium]